MKKNLLLFAMALLPLFVQGAVGIDGVYYELLSSPSGNTAAVTSHPYGYTGELIIPPTVVYKGVEYDVTSIIDYAISNSYQLTSVSIAGSVATIGECAFSDCRALATLTLHDGIETIGPDAFYGCTCLTSVTIPGSVTTIGSSAFGLCTQMTSATIEYGVPTISDYAFVECTSLTSVSPGFTVKWNEVPLYMHLPSVLSRSAAKPGRTGAPAASSSSPSRHKVLNVTKIRTPKRCA